MHYQVIWKTKAIKQTRKLPLGIYRKLEESVDCLVDSETWKNVKSLKNHKYDYRMRVGSYRVLLTVDKHSQINIVNIEEVRERDERTY